MKRLFFTIATLILIVQSVSAQRKGLWIAPQVSLGGGTLTGTNINNADVAINFNIGADAYYMFNDNIGAGLGMAIGGYGAGWRESSMGSDADYIIANAGVDIPLFFRYTTGLRHGFFVQAGIVNSFVMGAEQRLERNGQLEFKIDGDAAKDLFSPVSVYPFVFLGGNIAIGNRVQLSVGPYLQYQANNNFSSRSPMDGRYLIIGGKVAVGIHVLRK